MIEFCFSGSKTYPESILAYVDCIHLSLKTIQKKLIIITAGLKKKNIIYKNYIFKMLKAMDKFRRS